MAYGAVGGPTEVADTPTLEDQNLDHLFTDHGSDVNATLPNNTRKSKFYSTDPQEILKKYVFPAFQAFANWVDNELRENRAVYTDVNGKIAWDCNLNTQVGSGLSGDPTTSIRLVMAVSPSGKTKIITAFPL